MYFSPCPRNMWRSGFNQKYCLSEYIIKQEKQEGISLGVQWFRLLWPNTGDAGSISGQGTMILHAGQCGQKLKKRERGEKMEGLCNRVLPKNRVHLLVGVKPKDTTKPEIRTRKNLLFFAVIKENTSDLSQSSVFLDSRAGEDLS